MSNRVALVTGGAQGIGAGIAQTLGEQTFRVGIADLNLHLARAAAESITAAGGRAVAVQADITDIASVQAAVKTVTEELGPVEVVVNNAGWDDFMPFLDTDEEFWDRILDINFKGALRDYPGHRAGDDRARLRPGGEHRVRRRPGGVVAGSRLLRRQGRHHRVHQDPGPRGGHQGRDREHRVSGTTDTPALRKFADNSGQDAEKVLSGMVRAVPMRRLATPADVAAAVAFFASDAAGYITGQPCPSAADSRWPDMAGHVVGWRSAADGIRVLALCRPPANALGLPLIDGLNAALDDIEAPNASGRVKVVVVTSEVPGFFAAGSRHQAHVRRGRRGLRRRTAPAAGRCVGWRRRRRSHRRRRRARPGRRPGAGHGLYASGPASGGRFGLPEVKLA